MPRPQKPRWVNFEPSNLCFFPGVLPPGAAVQVMLTVDELEALRLADLHSLSHEAAAAEMNVSRATFGRIVARARMKTADALVHGKSVGVQGGVVRYHPPYGLGRGPGPHGPGGRGPGGRGPGGRGPGRGGSGRGRGPWPPGA